MRLLAVDASGPEGGVAVRVAGREIFRRAFGSPRGRGGEMFVVLAEAMAVLRGYGGVDRIVAGLGPGSYNGLRTSLAAVDGLRMATGAELVGIASVRCLAAGVDVGDYYAVGDARGGSAYCARVTGRVVVGEMELVPLTDLAARLEPGVPTYAPGPVGNLERVEVRGVDVGVLAELGEQADAVAWGGGLEPIYLKPPHITLPRGCGSVEG